MLMQSHKQIEDESAQKDEIETIYLKTMRQVLQEMVSDKLQDKEFIASILKEETIVDLYRRKIWLALD